jgi:hypothetical protein
MTIFSGSFYFHSCVAIIWGKKKRENEIELKRIGHRRLPAILVA